MSKDRDYNVLRWIKGEIDATVRAARETLERYVEGVGEPGEMKACGDRLHQIHGTLLIAQVFGAAMLAEEMEAVARAIDGGHLAKSVDAAEPLMLGLVSLPDYLEQVREGAADAPLALLPLMNELRAVRDAPLLSEASLFGIELERWLREADQAGEPNPELAGFAYKVRHRYHQGLLGVLRGTDTAAGLCELDAVVGELAGAAGTAAVSRLFQAAGGLMAGMQAGAIDLGFAVKHLLGEIDRETKRVIDEGEAAVAAEPAFELFKNLLFYVARSATEDPRVQAIKDRFELGRYWSAASGGALGSVGLSALTEDVLSSVREAIAQDLIHVKDSLDLFMRGGATDMERLRALHEPLNKVADTLGMVGQGGLRERLKRLAVKMDEAASAGATPSDAEVMDMASDIIFVESSLSGLGSGTAAVDSSPEGVLPAGELQQLVKATLHESGSELAKAKEAIASFVERPQDQTLIQEVPGRFRSIAGAFKIIDLAEPADMMDALAGYMEERVVGGGPLSVEAQDALADVVTSVEFYADAVSHGERSPDSILEVAREGLARLGLQAQARAVQPESVPAEGEMAADEPVHVGERPEVPEAVAIEAPEEAVEAEVPESVAETQAPEKAESPTESAEVGGPGDLGLEVEAAEEPAWMQTAAHDEEGDTEIIEIFLEEAREELGAIREQLPRWEANRDDREALSSFRRSFHTLKGSGRLVGASVIGEYAWSVENLLNRLIEGSVMVSPEILEILHESLDVLPKLIHSQETGDPHGVPVDALMERAFVLAGGKPPGPSAPPRIAVPAPAPPPASASPSEIPEAAWDERTSAEVIDLRSVAEEVEAAASPQAEQGVQAADITPLAGMAGSATEGEGGEATGPGIVLDPALAEIFQAESRTHLDALTRFVEEAEQAGYQPEIPDSVCRALHTLHGSAHMAEVEPVAGLAAALERYTNELRAVKRRASWDDLQLIAQSVSLIETVLGAINAPGAPIPQWRTLAETVDRARDLLEHPDGEQVPSVGATAGAQAPGLEAEGVEAEGIEVEGVEAEAAETLSREAPVETSVPLEADLSAVLLEEESLEGTGELFRVTADEELVAIFLEEARELVESMDKAMEDWVADPMASGPVASLQRTLHTLKGGARLAGISPVGDLSHNFESLLTAVDQGRILVSDLVVDLAQRVADRLVGQIDELTRTGRVHRAEDLLGPLEAAIAGKSLEALEHTAPEVPEVLASDEAPEPAAGKAEASVIQLPARERPSDREGAGRSGIIRTVTEAPRTGVRMGRAGQEQVRVRAELLDRLVNNAGEVSIYRARLEQQSGALGFNLAELDQTVSRLHRQLRQLEIETEAQILFRYERDKEAGALYDEDFDPLEMDRFSTIQQLSRSLAETVNDLVSIRDIMDEVHRVSETLLLQQSRVTTDLQDGLLRTRMIPFSTLVPRLHRVVRQTCAQMGNKAELRVHGAEGEMDRGILERMVAPLEHILRNAVAHGIESDKERVQAGKPETGSVSMLLSREGTDVVLTVSDDGRGLQMESIRKKAIERGLLASGTPVSDDDLMQFILEHGFSTSDVVTQISGRGVGMDVVVSEVKQLGGTVEIESQRGRGSSFTVRLPLTLAITYALLVQLNEMIYAIPHTAMEGVVRASRKDIEDAYAGRRAGIEYAGHTYAVRYLGAILDTNPLVMAEQTKWVALLLVRAGEHRVALQVDGLVGNRQIVVKSVGPQLSSVRWITGGTILADGRVALILDVNALVRMAALQEVAAPPELGGAALGKGVTVMVVDDSITVRKVTSRLLERHNMNVITAKDGVDAVAKLQEQVPDVMLLDIEMPRMDGYELARHMHNSPDLAAVPIIMITSRMGEKHRTRAFELGVDRYLGKPYQETDLLENIYSLLAETQS